MRKFRPIFKILIATLLVLLSISPLAEPQAVKLYIDVNAPNPRPLPIAIQSFENGREISEIVANDLTLTGLFHCIPQEAQIEANNQPFNVRSWAPLNVVLVVKGFVSYNVNSLNVTIRAYDVNENREVLVKEYSALRQLLRPIAHSISNDLYKLLTGQEGIFRTRLAFVVDRGKTKELYLSDYDGHRVFNTGVSAGIILTPRWSPDGKHLLYSAERNRSWDIYLLNLEEMREKLIVSLKGLNLAGNFFPDGRSFVFSSSKDGKADIHRGDIGSMKGYKLIGSPWIDVSPNLSPDGKQMVFVSNRSGSPQIYLSDSDGNNIRRLTFEGSYNTSASWSPKGDRIVFTGMVGGRQQIFTIKPDGSSLQRLTEVGNNEDPSFSPDGRYIVFSSDRDGTTGLYIMRSNGQGQVRITPKGLRAYAPSWSP